jgi:hypothetical protein
MLKKLIILSIFLFTAPSVFGCLCTPPTVTRAFNVMDTVAKVRLVSHRTGKYDATLSVVEVIKTYKGTIKPRERVTFSDRIGKFEFGCIMSFKDLPVGAELLVYTNAPDKKGDLWHTSTCNRTQTGTAAKYDLAWLEGLPLNRSRTRIYGYAGNAGLLGMALDGQTPPVSLAGTKIVFRGSGKEFTATTNEDGFFELLDVPPGFYVAEPLANGQDRAKRIHRAFSITEEEAPQVEKEMPDTIRAYTVAKENKSGKYYTYVPPGRDAEISFEYAPWNRVAGRVTGPDGKPIAGAPVTLLSFSHGKMPFRAEEITNENGWYEFTFVAAGECRIVVNESGKISAKKPYSIKYWGEAKNGMAGSMPVDPGMDVTNADIRIGQVWDVVTISGSLQFQDGKPYNDRAQVSFQPVGEHAKVFDGGYADVDRNGRFVAKVIRGTDLKLSAIGVSGRVDPKICDQAQERATDDPFLSSNAVVVTADRDISGLILKIPFKSCAKPLVKDAKKVAARSH